MFKLNEKYQNNRNTLNCDYIRYSPSEISTTIIANSQKYIKIPKRNSISSPLISYLDINFDALLAATHKKHADIIDIKSVILGPIALFSTYKLTTTSGKHLEDFSHVHIVSLLYKLIASARGSHDLSMGFDRDRGRRQRELTDFKNQKVKYPVRIQIKVIFGFAQQEEKATFGIGDKLTITRKNYNCVLNTNNAIKFGENKINVFE